MAEQKAFLVTGPGNPVVLGTRPIPTPGPNEVLVKMTIAGLNPHDQLVRDIAFFVGKHVPTPFGIDLVGVVHALGPNVSTFNVGDAVFGNGDMFVGDYMATQEYAIMDVNFMGRIPASITQDEAATLPLNVLTMYIALFHSSTHAIPSPLTPEGKSFDYENTPLAIIGAGSNCGQFAIQTLSDDEIETEVRSIVGDDLLHVCTAVLAKDQTLGARILSNNKKGTLVTVTHGEVDKTKLNKRAGYELRRFLCHPHAADNRELSATFWKAFPGLIEQRILRPTPYQVIDGLNADKVNEVLDEYREGKGPTRPNIHISAI
ncbi:GroES-like protein [Trichoderma aethiopicum]